MPVTRIHPETGIHPEGQDADIIMLPAPGRKARKVHPTAGPVKQFIAWTSRIRVLQIADGRTFEEAIEQANDEFNWPGRKIK